MKLNKIIKLQEKILKKEITMAVDRHLWIKDVDLKYRPTWTCPACSKGRFILVFELLEFCLEIIYNPLPSNIQ